MINVPGFNRTASASPKGGQFGGDLDGGYEFHFGSLTIGPSAGFDYVHWTLNSYSESGAGVADLNVDDQNADSLRSHLGFSARYLAQIGKVGITPHLNASWQHEYLNNSRAITSSLSQPGIDTFSVQTTAPNRDNALIDLGVDTQALSKLNIFIDYQAQVGSGNSTSQSVQLGAKTSF